MSLITFTYTGEDSIRADVLVSRELEISRSVAAKLLEDGCAVCMGKVLSKNSKVSPGSEITVDQPDPTPADAVPQDIPLDIVYEDAHLLVVNKPKGMVVHPAPGNPDGTLVNALLHHCGESLSGIGGVMRPGIVHRIDKDTSGLLIVAKNDAAHQGLSQQIAEHSFDRCYEAVVYGNFPDDCGEISAPIGRHPVKRQQMAVVYQNSKPARTHYQVVGRYEGFTHLRLKLETGRTHQIRVHMAYLGHPVAGDPVYGPKKVITKLAGQCLHAKMIGFNHPVTGQYLSFESELPDYFKAFLKTLKPTQ